MKIGFDAKWFFSGNPSGKVVVRNVLKHLLIRHPEHEYFIFLKSSEKNYTLPFSAPNVHPVYVRSKPNLLSNILFVPLRSLFLNLDVVFFQYSAPPVSPFKRIVYIYDVIFEDSPQYFSFWERLYYKPFKFLAKRAHRIATISNAEKKRIVSHGYGSNAKVDAILLGVDPGYMPCERHPTELLAKTRSEYGLPETFLLYVGRLNERKNLSNLLKAVTMIRDRGIKLVLAGSYQWKMFDVPAMVEKYGLKDRVILTGFVKDDLLAPLYSLATIFCYVSYDEGFGFPPLEAMAAGVPVVVANTGSLPEICGDAGSYCDPHKPEDIAEKINMLLENSTIRSEKRAIGLERAKEFSWEKTAEGVHETIMKTMNGGSGDGA